MRSILSIFILLATWFHSAAQTSDTAFTDTAFAQEYHIPYPVGKSPAQNDVRRILIDQNNIVWIATADGLFKRSLQDTSWIMIDLPGRNNGSVYSLALDRDSNIMVGAWNGIYQVTNGHAQLIPGVSGPVSVLCSSPEGVYALGPMGVWLLDGKNIVQKNWNTARSVRAAIVDGAGGLWVATEVGLYHCHEEKVDHYVDTTSLISASLRGLAISPAQQLWAAGLGGVSVVNDGRLVTRITPREGCPSNFTNCVQRSPDGSMWVGTNVGIVRYLPDGTHSLRFTRRWLLDDHVNDIAFDKAGNAWIATAQGVSAILKRTMTLDDKQKYFYDVQMRRHIRKPWISGQCHLMVAGDTSTWRPEDDDNDGEYGGNYLTMECFRYAVTKSEDARQKAGRAFSFLKKLREITGGDGYFARTIVPSDWTDVLHDGNRTYTAIERADELVKEPRFKPVETRWRKSADGKWLWKGDASSDEWCGHMMGYYFYYQLVANEAEKKEVRKHVSILVDHLIANDFNMMDVDGTHTRWSVWSPGLLNGDPEWLPDQSENSMELLAFLKLAFYMTGNAKYEQHYRKLIDKDHYLDNMSKLTQQNPAWFVYYDVIMQCYLYPILIGCEQDPKLKAWYEAHMDNWMKRRVGDRNPQIDFLYCYSRNKKVELKNSVDLLTDTPLDLVCWNVDHTKREDVHLVHAPDLSEFQVDQLPPASIRATIRWDSNPWIAVNGNPEVEREPVFWLLPYWLGRYLKMIR